MLALSEAENNRKLLAPPNIPCLLRLNAEGEVDAPKPFGLIGEPGVITSDDVSSAAARVGLTAEQGAR
jgi:hypothetical protein